MSKKKTASRIYHDYLAIFNKRATEKRTAAFVAIMDLIPTRKGATVGMTSLIDLAARKSGASPASVRRFILEMQEAGIIEITKQVNQVGLK